MRGLFWFRSDLRLGDNRGFAALAARVEELGPVFVFDPRLLAGERAGPARLRFLLDCLERLAADLALRGNALIVRHGSAEEELPRLLRDTGAEWLAWNRDYSPFARERDERVRAAATRTGARVITCKDRVVFESDEIRTKRGDAYAVYTPYRNAWRRRWSERPETSARAARVPAPIPGVRTGSLPRPEEVGAVGGPPRLPSGGEAAARRRLHRFLDDAVRSYARRRDRPDLDGTSRLSPHLRLGTLSVRVCVEAAEARAREDRSFAQGVEKWLDELVWRDFYHAVLREHPRVLNACYRRELDRLDWEEDEPGFAAWCEGRTGYPIVDAGMRQLSQTGWMHNRARMIVASFLAKDLGIDWRRGERFFQSRLVDGDPASNNGGWQWAASTGTDPQPYFRVFNPTSQGERHDPEGAYVRRWLPELAELPPRWIHRPWEAPRPPRGYPAPILDHAERRRLALRRYEKARKGSA